MPLGISSVCRRNFSAWRRGGDDADSDDSTIDLSGETESGKVLVSGMSKVHETYTHEPGKPILMATHPRFLPQVTSTQNAVDGARRTHDRPQRSSTAARMSFGISLCRRGLRVERR
jgi:hypothetical protein